MRPVRLRKNLHISLDSYVTKIHVDPISKKANLVEFERNNDKFLIRVTKEVILSAGAINSPQLLMLSGIGPKKHLESLNIPVLQDLSVGENLQDHVGMGGLTFVLNKPFAIVQARFNPLPMTLQYALNGKGPMTTLGGVEGLAFVRTKYDNESWPDIQFHMAPASINSDKGDQVKHVLGLTDELYDTVYKPIENKDSWTLIPLLLRPKSRGTIQLRSKNPFHYPKINANYFHDPIDIKILIEGAKIALKINNASPFQKLRSKLHNIPLPNCKHLEFGSDAYWECHIRTISMTIYHASGTCKMGPKTDPGAVVDSRLRVYGVPNLRVIDASIMPTITSGNTNAPVIMIAEKGSDLIKEDWLQYL